MTEHANIFESYIRSVIKNELNDQFKIMETKVTEEDAQKIVMTIIPHLDQLIADRVKQHFIELSDLIKERFTSKEKH